MQDDDNNWLNLPVHSSSVLSQCIPANDSHVAANNNQNQYTAYSTTHMGALLTTTSFTYPSYNNNSSVDNMKLHELNIVGQWLLHP